MKLAFNGQARYPDMEAGYNLYVRRAKSRPCVDRRMYNKVVKEYCKILAERLLQNGIADLPLLGSIVAASMYRKPQYRGKQYVGYGKMNWKTGEYDGDPKAFGLVFLPDRNRSNNLRCFGFVANRQLFKKVKAYRDSDDCSWKPMEFDDDLI